VVYAPLDIRERCPDANVYRCVKIGIVGVMAMWTFEDCVVARTSRTTEMADLRSIFSRNESVSYSFPMCLVGGVFYNLSFYPIADFPVVVSGVFVPFWIEGFDVFKGDFAVVLFSQIYDSSADVVSNPIVYPSYLSPEPLNLFACSLSFREFGFKFIDSFPENSDFVHEFSIFDELFVSDFSVSMENCYDSIVSESQIRSYDSFIFIFEFNSLLDWYHEVEPIISFNELKRTDFVFTVQSIFKQPFLFFTAFNWYCNPSFRTIEFYLKEEGKPFAMFEDGYYPIVVHKDCEFCDFWDRGFFVLFDAFGIGSEYSDNRISNFLNGLRTDVIGFSDLFVKFSVKDVLKVGFGYGFGSEFGMERVFDNIGIVNSRNSLICVKEPSQFKKLVSVNIFRNLHSNGFGNLHNRYLNRKFKYHTSIPPQPKGCGLLEVV